MSLSGLRSAQTNSTVTQLTFKGEKSFLNGTYIVGTDTCSYNVETVLDCYCAQLPTMPLPETGKSVSLHALLFLLQELLAEL